MKTVRIIIAMLFIAVIFTAFALPAFASETEAPAEAAEPAEQAEEKDNSVSAKAIAAGIAIGLTCAAGAIGMALAISKCAESMARQPEMAGKINSAMMLGLVFIETAIIYALIIAIIIIFVL